MRRLHLDCPSQLIPAYQPEAPVQCFTALNARSHGTVDSKDILLVQATSHPTTPSSGQELTTTPAKIMMTPQQQALSVLLYSLFVAQSAAWHPVAPSAHVVLRSSVLFAGDNVNKNDSIEAEVWRPDSTDPCWQNLLDSDCNMSNVYASNFVAGKWIKSMPCAAGIEVGEDRRQWSLFVDIKNLTPQHLVIRTAICPPHS
jgi:hypothetical protein